MAEQVKCPACREQIVLPRFSIPYIFAPTGNCDEYDYIHSSEEFCCPSCGEYLSATVEEDFKSRQQTLYGKLEFGCNPEWTARELLFSPDGHYLAVHFPSGVRVYENQAPSWQLIFQKDKALPVAWDATQDRLQLVIGLIPENVWPGRPGKSFVTSRGVAQSLLESRYKGEWCYQSWDIATSSKLWETRVDWEAAAAKPNVAASPHSHFLEVYPQRQYSWEAGAGKEKEYVDIHDLKLGQVFRIFSEALNLLRESDFRLNVGKNQILSWSSEPRRINNVLALWEFDLSIGSFVKCAEYKISNTHIIWATWEPNGTILVVERRGQPTRDNCIPYGLARLDDQSLTVLQKLDQVEPTICPSKIEELRHIQLLQSGEIFWYSDRMHILNVRNWQYQSTLPYPFRYEPGNRISVSANGQWIAVSKKNDVRIFNRNTKTKKGWSLRREAKV